MKKGKKLVISLLSVLGLLSFVITPTSLVCGAEGISPTIGLISTVEQALKYTCLIGDVLSSDNPLETAVLESGHGSLVGSTVDQSLTNYISHICVFIHELTIQESI